MVVYNNQGVLPYINVAFVDTCTSAWNKFHHKNQESYDTGLRDN